jgi:CheY-like chemotaxis protein
VYSYGGTLVRDDRGVGVMAVLTVTDVTERKGVELELESARLSAERAKAAAEEANRAKDHFIALLSHELRTPLSPVLTGVALLEQDLSLSPPGRDLVALIRRNVELESRLIDGLLDVTRIARGKVTLERRRVSDTMVALLELAGHGVRAAADFETALATLAKERIDLVISDLGLPDRSGLDLMRELRSRHENLPAIALSGYGQEADIERSRNAGFRAHLVKPVEPRRLLEVIENAVGSPRPNEEGPAE